MRRRTKRGGNLVGKDSQLPKVTGLYCSDGTPIINNNYRSRECISCCNHSCTISNAIGQEFGYVGVRFRCDVCPGGTLGCAQDVSCENGPIQNSYDFQSWVSSCSEHNGWNLFTNNACADLAAGDYYCIDGTYQTTECQGVPYGERDFGHQDKDLNPGGPDADEESCFSSPCWWQIESCDDMNTCEDVENSYEDNYCFWCWQAGLCPEQSGGMAM